MDAKWSATSDAYEIGNGPTCKLLQPPLQRDFQVHTIPEVGLHIATRSVQTDGCNAEVKARCISASHARPIGASSRMSS